MSHINKTAATTPFGLFEFVRMPFGLRNAVQTFQRFILHGIPSVYTYIDDVLIASATPVKHLQDLQTVFERLAMYSIVINPNKCLFGVNELDFLGHHINQNGITSLPQKSKLFVIFSPNDNYLTCEFLSSFPPSLCEDATCPPHLLQNKFSNTHLTWNSNAFVK